MSEDNFDITGGAKGGGGPVEDLTLPGDEKKDFIPKKKNLFGIKLPRLFGGGKKEPTVTYTSIDDIINSNPGTRKTADEAFQQKLDNFRDIGAKEITPAVRGKKRVKDDGGSGSGYGDTATRGHGYDPNDNTGW